MEKRAELRREHFVRRVPIKELVRRTGLSRNTIRAALRASEPPRYDRACGVRKADRRFAKRSLPALRAAEVSPLPNPP